MALRPALVARVRPAGDVRGPALAEETAIPYQTLINLDLRDCVSSGRRLALEWEATEGAPA